MLTDQRETSQFWFESHWEVRIIEGLRYRDSTVKQKLLEAWLVLFPNNQEIIFFKMRGLTFFSLADVALRCPPKFDRSISRDEVHHTRIRNSGFRLDSHCILGRWAQKSEHQLCKIRHYWISCLELSQLLIIKTSVLKRTHLPTNPS